MRRVITALVFREPAMEMFIYVVLAAVIYAILADRTDKAIEREMEERRSEGNGLDLVEDFDARPDLGPRFGRLLGRSRVRRSHR